MCSHFAIDLVAVEVAWLFLDLSSRSTWMETMTQKCAYGACGVPHPKNQQEQVGRSPPNSFNVSSLSIVTSSFFHRHSAAPHSPSLVPSI